MAKKIRVHHIAAGIAGALLAFLLLVLLLAPWLINTRAIEQQVRDVISERTGQSVTYDRLAISFFPRPHLTVDAFRLSLPGTAAATIETLKVYPEILPLFTGSIRLAKISMDRPEITIDLAALSRTSAKRPKPTRTTERPADMTAALAELRSFAPNLLWTLDRGKLVLLRPSGEAVILEDVRGRFHLLPKGLALAIGGDLHGWGRLSADGRLEVENGNDITLSTVNLASGRSTVSGLTARLTRTKEWQADVRLDRAAIRLDELYRQSAAFGILGATLSTVPPPSGTVVLTTATFTGPLAHPEQASLDLRGSVKDLVFRPSTLPDGLRIRSAAFEVSTKHFQLTNVRIEALDSSAIVRVSGTLALPSLQSADLTLDGTVGNATMTWITTSFSLPPGAALRTPLSLTRTNVQWVRGGTTSIAGVVSIQDGPSVELKMERSPDELAVERLKVTDRDSTATLAFRRRAGILDISFDGQLGAATLERIFVKPPYALGSLNGTIEAHLDLARPQVSRARGTLEADRFLLPGPFAVPLEVRHAALRGNGDRLTIDRADIAARGQQAALTGTVYLEPKRIRYDADLRSPALDAREVRAILVPERKETARTETVAQNKQDTERAPVTGTLRLDIGRVSYDTYVVEPLAATLELEAPRYDIQVTRAAYCGIGLTGSVAGARDSVALDLHAAAKDLDLETVMACSIGSENRISGTVGISADLASQGPPGAMLTGLRGPITISARDGQFLRSTFMTRLLALLNVTDILRGAYEEGGKGIRYRSLEVSAELRGQVLHLSEIVLDSEIMDLTGHGSISLKDRTQDFTMLVAPIKAGNWLVNKLPLVKDILGGALLTIAVKVSGPLNDPQISVLPAEAVGEGLVGITKRTLKLPFKIIEPIIEGVRPKE